MKIIYFTLGCVVLLAIAHGIMHFNDVKLLSAIKRKINERKNDYSDFFSIIDIENETVKPFSFKKALILVGLFYIVNVVSLFETKRYEITSDGKLLRTVDTYWGFKKKEFLLESRDGRWYAKRFKDGKVKLTNANWFEIEDDNDVFYDIEYEREERDWFD